MTFLAIAAASGVLTAVLLLVAPDPPVGPVAAMLALWLLPGYALQAAAIPAARSGLRGAERLVISVGLSLALLAGLAVVYDALGNRLTAAAIIWIACGATQLASVVGLVFAVQRRERLLPLSLPLLPRSWILPAVAVGIVAFGGLTVLMWKAPPREDLYVELSILEGQGNVPFAPLRVRSEHEYAFTIRVTSHEASVADYVVRIAGPSRIQPANTFSFALRPGQTIDLTVTTSWMASDRDPLTVALDTNEIVDYRSVRLNAIVLP